MPIDDETRIVACKRCGLHTRHRKERWIQRPLPLLLIGRVKEISGWVCTKCGRRRAISVRYLSEAEV